MYSFTDTTGRPGAGTLPAEAVQFDGKWLDREVPGFRTLSVEGREVLEAEVTDKEVASMNGAIFQYKTYPARGITVRYQMMADTDREFREQFNKLNALLAPAQAKLLFADEPDKYFIGSKTGNTKISGGNNHVVGEIDFYCTDPFKYSTTEKTVIPEKTDKGFLEASIVNEGTIPVPISVDMTMQHENGFVGIVSPEGVMEFGDKEEADTQVKSFSQTVINYKRADQIWAAKKEGGVWVSPYRNNGGTRIRTIRDVRAIEIDQSNTGSGDYWHGGGFYVDIPPNSYGSQNFKMDSKVWFEATDSWFQGSLDICISAGDKIIASVQIWKHLRHSYESYVEMWVGRKKVKTYTYNATAASWSGYGKSGAVYIQRSNGQIIFGFGGQVFRFADTSGVAEAPNRINLFFGCYSSTSPGQQYWDIAYADLLSLFWRWDVSGVLEDIPNRYREGDKLHIDGKNGRFYVNGIPQQQDEVVGTRYFLINPGTTKIRIAYSAFSDPPPTAMITFREGFM